MNNIAILPVPHRAKQKASYTAKLTNAEDAMTVLRNEMHGWHYKDLAKQVGVSDSCIMSIRSGRTKWPRPATFFALLDALEITMHLVTK
jgi:ribosome-binding protein aMBF1 (putative translation factor)